MAELLRFTETLADGTDLSTVIIDDTGGVERRDLHPPAGPAVSFGWWSGVLEDDALAATVALTEAAPPSRSDVGVLPGAGVWWASWADGHLPLVVGAETSEDDDGSAAATDDMVTRLTSALSDAVAAALVTERTITVETSIPDLATGHVMVKVSAAGADTPLNIDPVDDADEGSFVTEDFTTIGYLGRELTVPDGAVAFALLGRTASAGETVVVTGTVGDADDNWHDFVAHVETPAADD